MNYFPSRRQFLQTGGLFAAGSLLIPQLTNATAKPNPVILLTSGWQDINIGDIAHTPGLLAILNERLPQATVILWKKSKSERVEALLNKHYPKVRIINGQVDKTTFAPETDEVKAAFRQADFFLHGSGPSVVAADFVEAWHRHTGKPFGIFGVTTQDVTPALAGLLKHAAFIYTRETASIEKLRQAGLSGPHIAFAPDATFALTIQDPERARQFMQANGLQPKKFICAVPRLRRTPYYKLKPNNSGWSPEYINEMNALNDKWKEIDHAKLREAMIAWVRQTGNNIVVCPEMTYEVELMDELLINPLPDDVKKAVVKHDYWMPDEAASLYAQAFAVLSFECHSPIMALKNGTPSFYLRHPQDTIKGQMYYDLGLADWTFEIEQSTGKQIADRLMQVHANYPAAQHKVTESLKKVRKQYDVAFDFIKKQV
jgi:polysaccharide pyruvyl transferase WcaK-like protein